jgi:hypothetical protein
MSEIPSGTTREELASQCRRFILVAGVLGGLLGGLAAFAASRWIKPISADPARTTLEPAIEEARGLVDLLLSEVKAGKHDEFVKHVQMAMSYLTPDAFTAFQKDYLESRKEFPQTLGPPLGEFVELRRTALSPDLVEFVYMEKFERGGIMWVFVLYRGKDHWRLAWMTWNRQLQQAFGNPQ